MGWRPAEVKECSAHDFWSAWTGFVEYVAGDSDPEPMTRARLAELIREREYGRRT